MSLDERIRAHARAIATERAASSLESGPSELAKKHPYMFNTPGAIWYELIVLDFLEVAAGHGLTLENTASAEQFAAMVRGYILRDLPPELAAVLRPYLER